MKNLSNKELLETNGGGNSYDSAISASSSTESLLNLKFERSNSDNHSITEVSVGNNIILDFSLFGIGKH